MGVREVLAAEKGPGYQDVEAPGGVKRLKERPRGVLLVQVTPYVPMANVCLCSLC